MRVWFPKGSKICPRCGWKLEYSSRVGIDTKKRWICPSCGYVDYKKKLKKKLKKVT